MMPAGGERLPSFVSPPCPEADGTRGLTSWHALQHSLAASSVAIQDAAEVSSYLDDHPEMFEITAGICKAGRQEFGPEASLALRVYRDPEIEDEYLVLHVRLRAYGADTLPRLRTVADAFDNELCGASGSILVTTDFRPIR
jgi:hypothetical protein